MEDTFHLGIKALVRNEEGKILLLKVNPEALKKQTDPYWDLPGGRIERGSTIEDTLRREIKEETGIENITNIQEVAFVLSNIRIPIGDSDVGLILGIFSCNIPDEYEIKLSFEHIEYGWFPPVEVARLLEIKYPKSFTSKIAEL